MAEIKSLRRYIASDDSNTDAKFPAIQNLVFPDMEVLAKEEAKKAEEQAIRDMVANRKATQNSPKATVENNKKTPLSKKEEADKQDKEYTKNLLERSAGGVLGEDYQVSPDVMERVMARPAPYKVSPEFEVKNPELARLALSMAQRLGPKQPEDIAQEAQKAAAMVEYGINPVEAAKGVKVANVPLSKRQTLYPNYIPTPEEVGLLAGQAEVIRKATAPYSEESQASNKELFDTARMLLSEKMGKQYRNVDFAGLDKLLAGLGGWKPWGLENEPGPEKNLMLASQLAEAKQKFENFQQKQAQDYVEGIQKTLAAGMLQATKPVRQPATGQGQLKSVEINAINKEVEALRALENTKQHANDLLKVLEQMAASGTSLKEQKALYDRYNTLRDKLMTESKKAGGFGGALTNLEARLAAAFLPSSSYLASLAQAKLNFATKRPEMLAEIANLEEYSAGIKDSLNIAYPGQQEQNYIRSRLSGVERAAKAGALAGNKYVVKKFYSASANKTKLVYSDGTEEVVDGRK